MDDMRVWTLALLLLLPALSLNAQYQTDNGPDYSINSGDQSGTYRLYPTTNMWNFLKLNTRNGRIWQVQFDVEGNDRFESYLNLEKLVDLDEEADNRFILYPTQNIWNFILLDQTNGKLWQVQWSLDRDN
jgi:hypothetical protein